MTIKDTFSFLEGGGASAALIRDTKWTSTPLGPLETWPISLRTIAASILTSTFPAAIAWGPQLITLYNDPFRPILGGKPEAMGRPFSDVWSDVWDTLGPIAAAAQAGKATYMEDVPLTVSRKGYPEEACFTFCYNPLRDDAGQIAGLLATAIETTERVASERQARLMTSELQHRIKNMFATVNSIVSQTLRSERPLAEIRPLLLQRLSAIASAHALLTETSKGDVLVRQVLDIGLAPHRMTAERILMSGPQVMLNEKQALSLSLAINELATNAIKYGALHADNGTVAITWEGDGLGRFRLTWQENGGPTVAPPSRRGFGTTLMERVVPHDFGGTALLAYDPSGLRYTLSTDQLRHA
ncbi:HWE histidine kinase domain-containing protein [Rhizobium sp. SGZ-381]|uniref:HWE histidine kinase domain-containing protein n=1 Tax=Rhizobium sp. SGZ-381 TaxID=3342800 RepID=UPI003672ED40